MLKRKLNKTSFITTSFILLAVSSGSKSLLYGPGDNIDGRKHAKPHANWKLYHSFDSAGLCTCLSHIPEEELVNAPRIQLNANITHYVKDHHRKNGMGLEKLKTSGSRYFTLIDTIFTRHEVPVELKYLAVIESKLNTRAVSRVGAKGMWQFMPVTAREYGLKVKGKYDERVYAYKSTVAAARYLTYLYRLFDDWLLTVAAYNSGPGYVYAAIKKSGSRNFWVLQRFLPLETRNHVKRFISTHYYYEGKGSLATLTKSEREAHFTAVESFIAKQNELTEPLDSLKIDTETARLNQ
ncbi:MAG TPA: lytic transglycosylase domain-containing protein [Chitinophagaceae bacterium]|nr:lytic transglycosylase domain-containing protein [Chitinophagaceae bacterium]